MYRRLQELIRYVKLHFTDPIKLENRKSNVTTSGEVIISFTTTPERIHGIRPMLNSILDQDWGNVPICLNLSGDRFRARELPTYLERLTSIKINWFDKDLGPASKLLPTLENLDRDKLVIVVDDDQVYPRQLIKSYMNYSKRISNAAMTLQGWAVPKDLAHKNRKVVMGAYARLFDLSRRIDAPKKVNVLQGSSSYAVRPRFFSKELFQFDNAPVEAFYADDIWISGHLAKQKVETMVIPSEAIFARINSFSIAQKHKLINTHNQDSKNNDVLYHYFKDYWPLES